MPISDKKKCQTLINRCASAVDQLQAMASQLEALRSAYQAQSVDPTGTPLDGHIVVVSEWIDDVRAVADNAVANGLQAHRVPTHRNNALEV